MYRLKVLYDECKWVDYWIFRSTPNSLQMNIKGCLYRLKDSHDEHKWVNSTEISDLHITLYNVKGCLYWLKGSHDEYKRVDSTGISDLHITLYNVTYCLYRLKVRVMNIMSRFYLSRVQVHPHVSCFLSKQCFYCRWVQFTAPYVLRGAYTPPGLRYVVKRRK